MRINNRTLRYNAYIGDVNIKKKRRIFPYFHIEIPEQRI